MFRGFTAIIIVALITMVSLSCARPVRVEGTAMMPALDNGDRIILNTNIGEIERGEIISFYYPKDTSKWYIKRVIGLPNETIDVRKGRIYIDGKVIEEPYVSEEFNQLKQNFQATKIDKDEYFVLGDNRDNSSDSRYWGTVPKDLIIGTYSFKYF